MIPLKIEKTGESKLKKVKGINAKTGTPKVEAANDPATPHGIKLICIRHVFPDLKGRER